MKFNLNLKKGSYCIVFTWEGKQRYLFPGTSDPKAAEQVRARMEFEWNQGRFDPTLESYKLKNWGKVAPKTKNYNLLELFDLWTQSLDLSTNTYNNHYLCLRQFVERYNPPWANVQWFLELKEGWSAYTYNSRRGFLRSCIDWAINQELVIGKNPYAALKAKKKQGGDEVKPFSAKEITQICDYFEECQTYYLPYVVFQLVTGCRPGETIALQWKDVCFDRSALYVGKAFGRDTTEKKWATRKTLKDTKTGDTGYLPLQGTLLAILTEQFYLLEPDPEDLVFPGKKGGVLDIRNFRDIWKRALTELKIEYRYPYQCRHTALSRIATEQGLLAAAKAARHRNASMVSKHYGRFVDEIRLPDLPL